MPTYNPEVGRSQVGQNIVYDDDLIFYYDMYNEYTSFKGKPTTNLLSEPNGFTTWDLSSVSQENVFAVPYKKLVENTSSSSSFALLNSSVTFGLDYTMSVYAKKSERSFVQLAPSTGFSQGSYANYDLDTGTITGSFPANAASMEYIKVGEYKGWWRCQYTATSNLTTTSGRILVAIVPVSTSTRLQSYASIAGYGIYLRDMQMEQSSFATPFVDGTRSDTQSLVDLKGGHEITVKDLTYPNDNRGFNFSSTTSRLDIEASALSAQASSGTWTIDMWLKRTALGSGDIDTFLQTGSGNNFLWYFRQSTGNIELENTGSSTWSFTPTTDVYYHFVATGTGGTVEVFINGVSLGTNAATTTFSIAYANGICVGQELDSNAATPSVDPNQRFQGEIPLVRFYDRVLTDAEVRQNFIATRSKFGL